MNGPCRWTKNSRCGDRCYCGLFGCLSDLFALLCWSRQASRNVGRRRHASSRETRNGTTDTNRSSNFATTTTTTTTTSSVFWKHVEKYEEIKKKTTLDWLTDCQLRSSLFVCTGNVFALWRETHFILHGFILQRRAFVGKGGGGSTQKKCICILLIIWALHIYLVDKRQTKRLIWRRRSRLVALLSNTEEYRIQHIHMIIYYIIYTVYRMVVLQHCSNHFCAPIFVFRVFLYIRYYPGSSERLVASVVGHAIQYVLLIRPRCVLQSTHPLFLVLDRMLHNISACSAILHSSIYCSIEAVRHYTIATHHPPRP